MKPPLVKRAWRESARIVSQYAAAVARETGGRTHRILPTMYRLALARLRYDVGPRYYSLFEFASVPEASWSDFVTDDPKFKKLLEQMSPEAARDVANDKALFYRHCIEHRLPAIPILGLVSKRPEREYPNVPWIGDRETWRALMEEAPDELFIKPIAGTFGEGAFTVFRNGSHLVYGDREGSPDMLFDHLQVLLEDEAGWLIQPRLQSHHGIASIMAPQGVGTIRAVTCMDRGEPRLLLAILKITVGSNVTDNFHHGSTGNLVAPIDLATGALAAARGSTRTDWPAMTTVGRHPDTGHPIEGAVVPCWEELVALVLAAQRSLPLLKSAGWDIAVTPEGPILVETNAFYSVDILQVAYGRGLKGELMRQLGFATTRPN